MPRLWGRLAYADNGSGALPGVVGAPLIFLPGAGCDIPDWDAVIAAMPAGARCVRVDLRGHGQSDVPREPFTLSDLGDDVLALADHLELDRLLLVGHSLGGMAAMDLAARSDRVAGLVLLEGWTRLNTAQAFVGARYHGTLDQAAVAAIKAKHSQTLHRFPPDLWQYFWRSVETFDAQAYLQRAAIPICHVWGSKGRVERTQRDLLIPPNRHIRVVWLAGAGHYLPHERPREVAQICAAAAARLAAESA